MAPAGELDLDRPTLHSWSSQGGTLASAFRVPFWPGQGVCRKAAQNSIFGEDGIKCYGMSSARAWRVIFLLCKAPHREVHRFQD